MTKERAQYLTECFLRLLFITNKEEKQKYIAENMSNLTTDEDLFLQGICNLAHAATTPIPNYKSGPCSNADHMYVVSCNESPEMIKSPTQNAIFRVNTINPTTNTTHTIT